MAQLTSEQAFDLALQHHQAGRLGEAEQLYRQILTQQPDHAEALHFLGVIAHQTGRHDIAVDLIRRAIALDPKWPEAHNNLGEALRAQGHLDQAIAAYRQAITLDAGFPEAHNNLGNALREKGQLDDAITACRQAVALKPDYLEAHNNLGNALREQGQMEPAIAAYRQALALNPNFAEIHRHLGLALQANGQLDEAIAAFRQAMALNPNFPEAHSNLGAVLQAKGRLDEAVAAYRQAIALKPDYAAAHSNLGNALQAKGNVDEAIAAYRQAIVVKPDYAAAHNNLGNALRAKGRLDEAIAAYRQAIALKSDFAAAYNNLGNALHANGHLDEAIAAYRQALAINPTFAEAHSNLVYASHFDPACDAQAIYRQHVIWNQQHAEPLRKCIQPYVNDRSLDRRLRIGYVSPDFRDHVVGRFLLPLLEEHDKTQVEVFAYADVPAPDAMTQRLRTCTDGWRSIVGLSHTQAADLVRQDHIDILVDLTMHMANNRMLVFARKPAPVQVTYLAYCSTTGLDAIDYRLSDPYLDPPGGDESVYSEQTIRLPETYWCYRPVVDIPLQPPPTAGKGFITFGCLNNFCKVNEPLLSLWARVLRAVPNSRLLLHAPEGNHRRRALDRLQREGVEPQRVSFAGMVSVTAYFGQYQSIDVALDTLPYGGGTTTCDALWMGVPVVSLAGNTAVGRGGLSILSNVGLRELVADTPEQYVQIAVDLATDLPRLTELRASLRQRMEASPLMDAPKFARGIEAAYRQMWRTWCAGTKS